MRETSPDYFFDEKVSQQRERSGKDGRKKGFFNRIALANLALCSFLIFFGFQKLISFVSNEYMGSVDVGTLEQTYLTSFGKSLAGNWSQIYSSVPHLAGQGFELVNFTASKFEEYGLQTEIETFDVLLNYPVDHALKLIKDGSNIEFEASLEEDELKDDPTTSGKDLIPTFHGYSASGNVTAEYIYVNYGTKKDFQILEEMGIDLKNKIAIARYGHIFRGLKVKFAQEHGCVGVLLYSDPGDDNYKASNGDKPYPNGPARNPSSVQRGSVQFLSQQPGDPSTPGYPSQGNVTRHDPHDSIPRIPSLPVSFKDIEPILKQLNGHGIEAGKKIDDKWVGGLEDFNYWTGPNKDYTLNLYNDQSYDIRPIYNIYGKIEGRNPGEGHIIIGNHRDSWIKGGASDPGSGSAAMLEIIRGFHMLSKCGWKPLRTIVFASWDGEEYGLLGSTEYGEKYSHMLRGNCYAYLNVDVAVGGTKLNVQSSPSLNNVLNEAMHLVQYPKSDKNETFFDHFYDSENKEIGNLGSGSDFTVFLEHLGIPSVDLGFDHGNKDPVYHYHSNYDSYTWMSTMMDPGYKLHDSIAKYLGIVAIKLSNRPVIGMRLTNYAESLNKYFDELMHKVPGDWINKEIIRKHPCNGGGGRPSVTVGELIIDTESAFRKLISQAKKFDLVLDTLQYDWKHAEDLPFWKKVVLYGHIRLMNKRVLYWERNFITKKGLTGRPWFKHLVYAAGRDTGYEGVTFPGIREALEDNDLQEFIKWLKITHGVAHKLNKRTEVSAYPKKSVTVF